MGFRDLLRNHQPEYEIDPPSIRSIEIDGLGELEQRTAARFQALEATMREGHAFFKCGGTEAFPLEQAGEDLLCIHWRIRLGQHLAEDFETMLLASDVYVAGDALRLYEFCQHAGSTLLPFRPSRGGHATRRVGAPYGATDGAGLQPYGDSGLFERSFVGIPRVMVGKLLLVFPYLPVQLVHEAIDCRVHIVFSSVGVNLAAVYVYRGFRLMHECKR